MNYTREDLKHFYLNNTFPKDTKFHVAITDEVYGRPIKYIRTADTLSQAKETLLQWITDNTILGDYGVFEEKFAFPHAVAIDFGSIVEFGLIKVDYSTDR